jgi:hydroxyquinol 1,2-dioxygenase
MQLVTEDNITDLAVERWATAKDPRLAEIMTALVRHLHDFAREVRLTESEWMAAIQWLNRTGQISDEKRQEFILASDVLGLSMLVVQMNHRLAADATPNTVLGPFHIDGSPPVAFGADMSEGVAGTPLFVHGTVRDLSGNPVPGAVLDVWQADGDGMYEAQLEVDEARLRAKYAAREDGSYCIRTVAPLGYTIPMDGPVGELIGATAISHFRPAHVHVLIDVPGYEPLITHLFQEGAEHLDSDVVFGTKEELVVAFEPRDPGPTPDGGSIDRPWLSAAYDFVLQRRDA